MKGAKDALSLDVRWAMRLTSARELKQQLLMELHVPPEPVGSFAEEPGHPRAGLGQPLDGIALGIAPVKKDAFALAVRIQDSSVAPMEVIEKIRRDACKETDIRVLGKVEAQCGCGPLGSGFSAAHHAVTAGTTGPFVSTPPDRGLYVVSNNHVFADCNRAADGDDIQHPSPYDLAAHDYERIGVLARSVTLLSDQHNNVDAALCLLDDAVDVEPRIDGIMPTLAEDIDNGLPVEKIGRTTHRTTGVITAFEIDALQVNYPGVGALVFDGQIEVRSEPAGEQFSSGGDSGSLVFQSLSHEAVGLLFAGTSSAGIDGYATFVNPLPAVLDRLDATLIC